MSLTLLQPAGSQMRTDLEAMGWTPQRLRMVAAARQWMTDADPETDWTAPALRDLLGWLVLAGGAGIGFAWCFDDWRAGLGGGFAASVALFFAGPALSVREAFRQRRRRAAARAAELD